MARKNSVRVLWANSISIVARVASGVMIGIMLLFLLPLITPYLEDASSFGYIRGALLVEKVITTGVKKNVPTRIGGKEMARPMIIVTAFLLSGWLGSSSRRWHERSEYHRYRQNIETWRQEMNLSDNAIVLSPLKQKLEELKTAKKSDREQLLKEFVETKKKLDQMGRDLAFLSIDVADSTGMKNGEERASIEHDFKEYKRFVEAALVAHGCLKATWTPDGVMSCFTTVDAAVRAAREVITRLENFNRNVKSMRRDFEIRAGVNSGFVYFDDSLPLEEISDRVIDIAGHMQKHARPNTVCVAKPAIEPLNERGGFEPAGRMVDGYEVYEWRKG